MASRVGLWILLCGLAPGATGCGEPSCETCDPSTAAGVTAASSTGPSCGEARGTLAGTAYRYEGPGMPNSSIAPNAIILLQHAPTDTPLQGMADAQGEFAIELDAGDWLVGGEQMNCSASMKTPVSLAPCETETLELVLDLCTK